MPDKPSAEFPITAPLVRRLLTQANAAVPDASARPLVHSADGWDCAVWRLGDDLAVRLPRRALAAPLVRHEQTWLPELAARVESTGVRLPSPVFDGAPDAEYPWPWSIVPWIDGTPGLEVARRDRTGWAVALAAALGALHTPAPADHPVNRFRGVPLAERDRAVRERLSALRNRTDVDVAALEGLWAEGLAAEPWDGPTLWVHGDLHPGNLIAEGAHLRGIIDFGDITAGDPSYDLAIAWLAFDVDGRRAFVAATGSRYDAATWVRARAWAASVSAMLLHHSDDNPSYAALGAEAATELTTR